MAEQIDEFMQKLLAMSRINNDYSVLLKVISEEERRQPDEHMIHVLKGWVYTKLGDYDKASKEFDRALAMNPESGWAYFRKGQMLAEQEHHREALECFRMAVKYKALRPEFWVEKGLAEDEVRDVSAAYESYEKAIHLGDKTGWGWAGKARTLATLNRLEDALEAARTAIKLNPDEGGFRDLERVIIDRLSGY